MAASCIVAVLFIFHQATAQIYWQTTNSINWHLTDESVPFDLKRSIQVYHDDHFIILGGHLQKQSSSYQNRYIYVGDTQSTTAPTFADEFVTNAKKISSWTNYSLPTYQTTNKTSWVLYSIDCVSQCHSTNSKGIFFLDGYGPSCSEDLWLYRLDHSELIYSSNVVFDRYNLTQLYMNKTYYEKNSCKFSDDQRGYGCVATNPDNFAQTQMVYVVLSQRIVAYNISSGEGYSSPGFTSQQRKDCYEADDGSWDCPAYESLSWNFHQASCTFDVTGKYIWIAGYQGNLWRYSVESNSIVDVSMYTYNKTSNKPRINNTLNKLRWNDDGTLNEDNWIDLFFYYDYDLYEFNKMVPLSHGFILLVGNIRDYIILPNVTEAYGQYATSKTKYIDFVCAGRSHFMAYDYQPRNALIYFDSNDEVLSLGGYTFSNVQLEPNVCKGCEGDGSDRTDWSETYTQNLTGNIRSYAWMQDFSLVINFTEEISFGDSINFDVYFEPSCDLSPYMDVISRGWTATEFNPLLFELYIEASDDSLEIETFMYIINATEIEDRDGWDSTYSACYLCPEQQQLSDLAWNNEDVITNLLSSDIGCTLCSDGVQTGSIKESQAGTQYYLSFDVLNSPNNSVFTLDSDIRNFTMTRCGPGYGTTVGAQTVDCNQCPFNQFTLQESLDPCIPCDDVSDDLVCEGGNATTLTYNHWVAAWDAKKKYIKPFYDIEYDADNAQNATQNRDKIITSLCPPKYCCQDVKGCDYLSEYLKRPTKRTDYWCSHGGYTNENGTYVPIKGEYRGSGSNKTWHEYNDTKCYNSYQWIINETNPHDSDHEVNIAANGLLCAFGRDVDVPLCGACLDGYAELLGTTQCSDCDGSSGWFFILLNSFCLTFFLSLYIIFCDSKPVDFKFLDTKKQLMIQDDITGFQTLIFKPVLYYFQSINPILDTRGIKLWISPVVAFFNFSFDTIGDQDLEVCWSENLDATGEILINLLLPAMLMFHLILPRTCVNTEGFGSAPCCCCCKKKKICCCCCKNYQTPYYTSAFFRVLLITIGVVLTVCFKYLTYVEIEEKKLLFYSADKEAFGGWWFGGFLGVLFVITVFVIIYIKIKQQQPTERFSTNSIYRKFVKSFREKFWFWEFVLFSRRFFISCFTSIQFVGGGYTNFIFMVILLIYLVLNVHYKPFAYSRVNKIETLCLVLLIAAFVASNFIEIDDDDLYVGWMLSLCILIPLVIVAFYGLKIVMHRMQWCVSFDDDKDAVNKKVQSALQRMPKSFRDIMKQEMGASTDLELATQLEENTERNAQTKTLSVAQHKVSDASEDYQNIDTVTVTQPKSVEKETAAEAQKEEIEKKEGEHMSDDEKMLEAELVDVLKQDTLEEQQGDIL